MEPRGEFVEFPDDLNHTFSFTDLQLRWDNKEKSFISEVANGVIFGFGSYSYILAVMAIKNLTK